MRDIERRIREAVARGWCAPVNSGKEMDSDLAEAIIAEVVKEMALLEQQIKDVVIKVMS